MKILIIGNGFLATSIIDKLESEGHEILIFSRTQSTRLKTQQVLGNIFEFEEFVKVLAWNPQVVINTAWITTPGVYRNDQSNFQYAEFVTNLTEAVVNSDVAHLVVLGTCAEYGLQIGPSTAGVTKLSPTTLYAQQKVIALNSAKVLIQESDMRFTWARIFYPYGPNQDPNRLIPRLIHSLRNGEPIALADVSSVYDWITTRDIASAISWILGNELPVEIDIGTSFGFTNLELLTTLEKLVGVANLPHRHLQHDYGLNEVFVTSKNSPLLESGWSAKDSLSSGLEWVLEQ
jgi:dTDP-6-deoxy-L-talose 4-dehydrogenase (NAD+)